jgi:hypothetical protein
VKADDTGKVTKSGVINGNHRLIAAFETRKTARVALRIEMGDREIEKTVILPLSGLRPKYVGRAKKPMSEELNEATTNHDEKGHFCGLDRARTVVKDGVRHRVIGTYNRKTGSVKRHPRKRPKSKAMEALDHAAAGKAKIRNGRPFIESDRSVTIEMDDAVLVQIATEIVKADPKSRFSPNGIRRHLSKKHSVDFVTLVHKGTDKPYRPMKEVDRLSSGRVQDRKFKSDRSRGFFRLMKQPKGKGLKFQRVDADDTFILYGGEQIGEIERQFGLIPDSATRESEHTWDVSFDQEEVVKVGAKKRPKIGKAHFTGLNAAKKWARAELKAAGLK